METSEKKRAVRFRTEGGGGRTEKKKKKKKKNKCRRTRSFAGVVGIMLPLEKGIAISKGRRKKKHNVRSEIKGPTKC